MKRADIEVNGEYAVSIPSGPWPGSRNVIARATVNAIEPPRHVHVYVPEQQAQGRGNPPRLESGKAKVALGNVLAPWDAYCYERDYDEAVYLESQRNWRLDYDAKKKAAADRWEATILPAFKGLPCDEIHRQDTLEDVLRDYFVHSGSMSATLRAGDIEPLAAYILELREIVAQNALTHDDLPQAGWGVPVPTTEED